MTDDPFEERVHLTRMRFVNETPLPLVRSRVLTDGDLRYLLELRHAANIGHVQGLSRHEGNVSTKTLSKRIGRSRQGCTKAEAALKSVGLLVRDKSRFMLPSAEWITIGQIIAMWPVPFSDVNSELWSAVLTAMGSHDLVRPYIEHIQNPLSKPWPKIPGLTSNEVRSDFKWSLPEPLKSVLMPINTMPLPSKEEEIQGMKDKKRSTPSEPTRLPGLSDSLHSRVPGQSNHAAVQASLLDTEARREREANNAKKRGHTVRKYQAPSASLPASLDMDNIPNWKGYEWVRFLSQSGKNFSVPMWFDDAVAAAVEEARDAKELIREGEILMGVTDRAKGTRESVMAFVRAASISLFGKNSGPNRERLAYFLTAGLFPNWQYYRSQILHKKNEDLFSFHPKYITTAVDTLHPVFELWQQAEARAAISSGPDDAVERFRRVKKDS